MLPADLSEGITSLNENEDRVADVIEFTVDPTGCVSGGTVYRALVRNRAQLAYNSVGAWLEGRGPAPAKVAANADLAAQLKLQDKAAQGLVGCRFQHGALDLETIETQPLMSADDQAVGISEPRKESSHIPDRRIHGRGQRHRRSHIRGGRDPIDLAHRAHPKTLGSHGGSCQRAGDKAARAAGFQGAQ